MKETIDILDQILVLINEDLGLSYLCKAFKAYDTKNLPIPVSTIYFTVACENNNASYFENEEAELCMKSTITIRINCFTPLRRMPYMSHSACEIVMKFISDYFMPDVKSCTVGETEYDSAVKAFKIPCTMVLEYTDCPGQNSLNPDFADTSQLFCKSHLKNKAVHLTESDRVYLDSPCVVGTYTGDGVDTGQYITLGFRPKCVIIYRQAQHAAYYNPSSNQGICNIAVGTGTTFTRGIVLTDTGFRSRTVTTSGVTTQMNDSGIAYSFIAFR